MPTFGKTDNQPTSSDSQEKKYESIPAGTYNAEVARLQAKEIDLAQTPWLDKQKERGIDYMISFGFKIVDGKYKNRWFFRDVPAEISDWSGCKLRLYLQELLGGLTELPEGFEFDPEDAGWIGLPCRIRVDEYESKKGKNKGTMQNSIDDVLAATAAHPGNQVAVADEYEAF